MAGQTSRGRREEKKKEGRSPCSPPGTPAGSLQPSEVAEVFIPVNLQALKQWEIQQGPIQENRLLLEAGGRRSLGLVTVEPQVLVGLWAGGQAAEQRLPGAGADVDGGRGFLLAVIAAPQDLGILNRLWVILVGGWP